ncbi:hypothetical protein AB1N83_002492 [Pleurotus pulmonarius]
MCHILCFLTGAGLATYLARRRHDPLYDDDDDEDVYYGDRMRERNAAAAAAATTTTGSPYAAAPRAFEQGDRKQQQEARVTGERGRFRKSLSKVTKPLVEFFQNVGDALDDAERERQARRTTATTTTAATTTNTTTTAEAPQPQPMAEKSPLPESGATQRGEY